jgi:Flp pilus assembly pilin Flp
MRSLFARLWNDDRGVIITFELLFLFVILVLGLIAGWTALRNALDAELTETAQAILSLDQSYIITGVQNCGGANGGGASQAIDITAGSITLEPLAPTNIGIVDQSACP